MEIKPGQLYPSSVKRIEDFHKSGDLVIFLCDFHHKDDREFEPFSPQLYRGNRRGGYYLKLCEKTPSDTETTEISRFYKK